MRQRWLGATGRRVPQLALEGELDLPEETLVLDDVSDDAALRRAHDEGRPVVVRASTAEQVLAALTRPEVAAAIVPPELLALDLRALTYGPIATYSIVACDLTAREWGVAVQSKFLAVGSVVPWAEPEVGAVATQSYANPRYGPDGLELLRGGASADETVAQLTQQDEGREHRQVGVVDANGTGATFTGSECHDWAGGRVGPGYAAQGNILVSEATVDALAETFEARSDLPLAERLVECLAAAQAAGGDRRGQQSASLLVVRKDGGYAGLSDVVVDLRADDHEQPIEELRRLYRLHDQLFGSTPRDRWVDVDESLATELSARLAELGYEGEFADALFRWAGDANLEERVDGAEQIDPVVLKELRGA